MANDLKSGIVTRYIGPYLGLVVVACLSVLGLDWLDQLSDVNDMGELLPLGGSGLVVAAFALLALLLRDVLPRSWKECVVFWRMTDRLPAHRAFCQQRDSRVNWAVIEQQGGVSNLSAREQNSLWYSWYRAFQQEPSVLQAHRSYLACRDLAAVVLISAPAVWTTAIVAETSLLATLSLSAAPLVAYGLAIVVARNKANDMMMHVLALKSAGDA